MYGMNYNPYENRYLQKEEITQVNGENGARAYRIAPNSSAILLDVNNPLVWLVQSDGAGYKTVKPYTISEYKPEPEPDIKMLEERINKIEELLLNESYSAKPTEPTGSDGKKHVQVFKNGKESEHVNSTNDKQ